MTYSPIALFVYNRPTHTRQTVEALQKNALAIQSDLIIFSDAPKDETQADAVRDVRQYIHQIDGFKSVTIVERKMNFGLANSIIDGVTSIVNERGRIIVLEDDLIVAPHFLDYMNLALDKYQDEPKAIQISGYMFPVKLEIKEDALFLPLTTSWGWATWKRAWDLFDPDARGYARVSTDPTLRERFNLDGAYDYFSMLEAQMTGKVDSWAIRWYLSAFMLGALTLYPRQSLIKNVGFDGSGTHKALLKTRSSSVDQSDFILQKPLLPETIAVSGEWDTILPKLFSSMTIMQKIKTYLKPFYQAS